MTGTRKLAFGLSAAGLSLVVALGFAEVAARSERPPRVQTVYSSDLSEIHVRDGRPYWIPRDRAHDRRNPDCLERGQAAAMLVGDSILYGARVPRDQALGGQLEALLRQRPGLGDACVLNASQPGYAFQNQLAAATALLDEVRPKVIYWEIWQNSVNRFEFVGDSVYNFGSLVGPEGGVPSAFGLPEGLNRALFGASALYRQANLRSAVEVSAEDSARRWDRFVVEELPLAEALAEGVGAELVLVFFPGLGRPLDETARRPSQGYRQVMDWADEEGHPWIWLAEDLKDQDVEAIRLDPCCHFNAVGLALVAEMLDQAWPVEEGK